MTDPEAIESSVTTDATVAGFIADRIYPLALPDAPTLPAITYGLVSQPTDVTQDSAQSRSPRWRLSIWSRDYADLVPIAQGLAGIFGDQARTPFPSSRIEYPASQAEMREPDTHFYRRLLDVVVGSAPAGSAAQ